ncbi:MAG: hypothetical protein E7438_02180 [Ruminococcaceae bacterium]|nr:hypothetical protein [Oscillospiraceae bacterium]
MKCKFCNEELSLKGNFCPVCGGNNSAEQEAIVIDPEDLVFETDQILQEEGEVVIQVTPHRQDPQFDGEEWDDEALDGEEFDDEEFDDEETEDEEPAEEPVGPSAELKRARFVSALCGCVAALAVLAVVLFAGISGNFSKDGKGWDVGQWFSWLIPKENNVLCKDSFTVSAKKAMKKRDVVVATVPGAELTNGELQIYYWNQVYDFLNSNSYYLSYYGLDYTAPLDEQMAYDKSGTWQQYFLESAIEMWHGNVSFAMLAKQNNYQLSAEEQAELDGLRESMETTALKNGFASAEEMLQDSMGPGCTMDDYIAYMETYYLGYCYFAELYGELDPTMEQIEAYFAANEAAYAQKNITKDGGYTVDIRHILIKIEELTEEDGEQTQSEGESEGETEELIDGYTQAAWNACLAKANEILDQWLNGEKTEDSFAELAKTHSADGNASEGGIYTGVAKGDMLETFDAWCFEEIRVEGDYGIVRTKYGYHIIYFISKEDIWVTQARADLLSEEAQKIVQNALDACPMEVIYKKIVLGEVSLA